MYLSGKYIEGRGNPVGAKIKNFKDYPILRIEVVRSAPEKSDEDSFVVFYFNKWLTLYSYDFEWWTLSSHTQDELSILEERLRALAKLGENKYEVIRVLWVYQADDQVDKKPMMVQLSIGNEEVSKWILIMTKARWVCPVTAEVIESGEVCWKAA